MFDEKELTYLEDMINESIYEYLDSGYRVDDDYVVTLRNMLKKLGLKEYYKYDEWREK